MASLRGLLAENRRAPVLLAIALFLLSLFGVSLFSGSTTLPFSNPFYPSPSDRRFSNPVVSPSLPFPSPISNPNPKPSPVPSPIRSGEEGAEGGGGDASFEFDWVRCRGGRSFEAVDYIPCLDNERAIKGLKSRRHMEHRERHCPLTGPTCLVPLPKGYRSPLPWPRSRDMIWYSNVPHPKLVEYKKDQNWVTRSGDYLVFPGGGTQFKEGVTSYIQFIEQVLPNIEWGRRTRVILDVGCGVASFGGYLLDKDVITMSFAPKDEHEAQIQFALERGIPAFLSVIGTQKLTFPDNVFDLIHCARCRVHWDANGGKPLLELNRILRPGGYFVWSATPVYRDDARDRSVWNAMVALTNSMCWKEVTKAKDTAGIGLVIYQKPVSNSCYVRRKVNYPPLCHQKEEHSISWYAPLDGCLPQIPAIDSGQEQNWPNSWPKRLTSRPSRLPKEPDREYAEQKFYEETEQWDTLVSKVYLHELPINWSSIRNVMDMNAGFGGFAAALINQPLWVMNTVPVHGPDTLPVIFDRGLMGVYHDWCESFNTYPRTYDLLHSSFLLGNLSKRCDIVKVVVEMERILRPGGWLLIQDTLQMLRMIRPMLNSLHYNTTLYKEQFLVGKKGFWRPGN